MLYFSGLVIHGFLLSLSLAAYILHPYGISLAYVLTITVGHRQADESAGTLVSLGTGLMRPAVTPWYTPRPHHELAPDPPRSQRADIHDAGAQGRGTR